MQTLLIIYLIITAAAFAHVSKQCDKQKKPAATMIGLTVTIIGVILILHELRVQDHVEKILTYLTRQWHQSRQPLAVKQLMVVVIIGLMAGLVSVIKNVIREFIRLGRDEKLEEIKRETADNYKKKFNYKGELPHGKEAN